MAHPQSVVEGPRLSQTLLIESHCPFNAINFSKKTQINKATFSSNLSRNNIIVQSLVQCASTTGLPVHALVPASKQFAKNESKSLIF